MAAVSWASASAMSSDVACWPSVSEVITSTSSKPSVVERGSTLMS